MSYQVNNAIIMSAGVSSRFAPLSHEIAKPLITVKGEVLIERQIKQLREAGIKQIVVVVGYMAEKFQYLKDKYGVILLKNSEYNSRNNNGSINVARDYLKNSYLCSADNYFFQNPFTSEEDDAYYSAVYAEGHTEEWCIEEGEDGYISKVQIGGENSWYMLGHTFWNERFSQKFLEILDREYDLPETVNKLWEAIFAEHLGELKMKIKKFPDDFIHEFDTLDELRIFDPSYISDTRSQIIKQICGKLGAGEADITDIRALKEGIDAYGFEFKNSGKDYFYIYRTGELKEELHDVEYE